MKLQEMINYKVSYEDQFKRFSLNAQNANFKEFCEKCIRVFKIEDNQTILVNFNENDKQLIIRNEVDFALAVNANIHNNKQKSISFKISTIPAETKLNQSQVLNNKLQESAQILGGSIELTNEDIQVILERGLNDSESEKILFKIANSIIQSKKELQINSSSLMFFGTLLKQKIQQILSFKQQQQLQTQLTEINVQQKLQECTPNQNDNIYESFCNQNISIYNTTTYNPKKIDGNTDIFEEFNASIASSQQNLKQSFESIFNQFNQSIQLLTQSVRQQNRISHEGKQSNKQYSNKNSNRESENNQKTNALSQFAFLSEYVDNIDEKLEAQEKQLIEEQDSENILITNLKDKIEEHTNVLKRVQKCQNKENQLPKTDLFDNIVKQVNDGLDDQLRGPFLSEDNQNLKSNDSNYQKIYKSN